MRAMVYAKYGPPEVLQLMDVETPTPKDNEVLVRVHAASVNSWDWDLLTGTPFLARLEGLRKPKYPILGADVAGRVEAVGAAVTRFRPGDGVLGDLCESGWGGFAEYVAARETALAVKPPAMSFVEAAATPQAGLLALQGLGKCPVQPGQRVLINGAGGGVGSFAIQIAKSHGAEVTGVDHPTKLAMIRSVGADHVIDYTTDDFTENGLRYDLILDVVARRSIFAYRRSLSATGRFVMVGGATRTILQTALLGPLLSKAGGKQLGLLVYRPNTPDLEAMKLLIAAGKVVPVIDRQYQLEEAGEALRHVGEGRAKGKVVVTI